MNTSEVLDLAADLIEERGWGKGPDTWGERGGPLCLEGGIMAALGVEPLHTQEFHFCPAHRAVCEYLGRDVDEDSEIHQGAWAWNDDRDRTAAEVIEVLRAAAMVERTREAAGAAVSA